jgi:hypothetical protein
MSKVIKILFWRFLDSGFQKGGDPTQRSTARLTEIEGRFSLAVVVEKYFLPQN